VNFLSALMHPKAVRDPKVGQAVHDSRKQLDRNRTLLTEFEELQRRFGEPNPPDQRKRK
jgi:hypothetical protein